MLFSEDSTLNVFQSDWLKYSNLLFYLSTLLIIYLTIFRLKRVEMSREGVFVTNYFKTVKYTYDSIDSLGYKDYYFFKVGFIRLKDKGVFGSTILFLLKKKYLEDYIQANPDLFGYMDLYL
ncbi:MAG: hypothetical protein EA409_00670 [Saprospirales bacterium]|nr:MAG: hypothetical protein EA409_00670 [Saprospirales bacterium]